MSATVIISTHRLELAGRLREAFQDEGYQVELTPSPDQVDLVDDPVLVVVTGERNGDGGEWARVARERLRVPLVATLEGANALERGRDLGADESFPADPDAEEVALSSHRLVERRRLQETTGIIGDTEPMREALERIVQIAPVESTVLITGESGTGKELAARGIHQLSPRRNRAFLAVNVAALSEGLLESELFGHEKGAFTGAIDTRRGFFELAHRGTLFLDEIGEMPLSTQTKLLRVLEQREFLRVGGEAPLRVDVRIIAATNQGLRDLVAAGEFRRDLYYRLNILSIHLPPLRERREDVPILIEHFVEELCRRMDRTFPGINQRAMDILMAYDWPGNVRELRNLVESMVVLAPGGEIGPDDLPREIRAPREMGRLLPVPARRGVASLVRRAEATRDEGTDDGRELRPELEFVFRTLMELRVDMDQLRREFEAYREEVDDRLEAPPPAWFLPGSSEEVEIGVRPGSLGKASEDEVQALRAPGEDDEDEGSGDADEEEAAVLFRPGMTMDEIEEQAIRTVLKETEGNRRRAAESLGIGERTLYRKIKKYGIEI